MPCALTGAPAPMSLRLGFERGRLDRMINDPQFSRWFSQAFAGS
jgi:hypothetical protein